MIEQSGNGLTVTGPMLIANARALLETGRGFLRSAAAGEFVVDLAAVAETDSAALSVVFGLLRSAQASGIGLRIANAPASMITQAALYGVTESLPLA